MEEKNETLEENENAGEEYEYYSLGKNSDLERARKLRRSNEARMLETQAERKRGRKRNIFYALIILFNLFAILAAEYYSQIR